MADTRTYKRIIADAEREVAELESRLQEARASLAWLRRRAAEASGVTPSPTTVVTGVAISNGHALDVTASAGPSRAVEVPARKAKPQRGQTAAIIVAGVQENPGLTSSELARLLESRVTASEARNKRKLIHSTLGYLLINARLVKDANGRFYFNQ